MINNDGIVSLKIFLSITAAVFLALVTIFVTVWSEAEAKPLIISLVSTDSSGGQGSNASATPAVSADGSKVAFESGSKLAGTLTGTYNWIFVKDTETGQTVLASADQYGNEPNSSSYRSDISADGRFVVFYSYATNLLGASNDNNAKADVFRKDLQTGELVLVSVLPNGQQGDQDSNNPTISADGRMVAFSTLATNFGSGAGIYVRDMQTGNLFLASSLTGGAPGNGNHYVPDISGDGNYVAFYSSTTNLSGNDTGSSYDIYVKDIRTKNASGDVYLVSMNGGLKGNGISRDASISDDGRYVVFRSAATNFSANDSDPMYDIYRTDRSFGTVDLVSETASGAKSNGVSESPSMSGDGRFITFGVSASNLDPADIGSGGDVYVKDMVSGSIDLKSASVNDVSNNVERSRAPAISTDGNYIVFDSFETDLVPGDTNGQNDVFITPNGRHYLFTWYDNVGGNNWALMGQPASASGDAWVNLNIAGNDKTLMPIGAYATGQLPPGSSITPKFDGLIGGPVDMISRSGDKMIASQRILWPKGGSSLEEVMGTDTQRLSDHFYWSWYDQMSAGYSNWVLVANPNIDPVMALVLFINRTPGPDYGTTEFQLQEIAPGENWTPQFDGKMGGPVEVKAYQPGGTWDTVADRRPVMASQRVLSGYGDAFNEAVGVPEEELSNFYYWPWYDDVGGQNWILLANPNNTTAEYTIDIGDGCSENPKNPQKCIESTLQPAGDAAGGDIVTLRLGVIDGPVYVSTLGDPAMPKIIASQRIIFGPSFGETMGYPATDLASTYHWSWYDQGSIGMQNWILVANASGDQYIDVEIWMEGQQAEEGVGVPTLAPTTWDNLAPGEIITPQFGSYIGGPVEVRAYLKDTNTPTNDYIIASQRVLYNGYFNEVLGTDLN